MSSANALQAKFDRLGDRIADLKKQGICTHGWLKTPIGQSETTCLDCGKVFKSFDQAMKEGKSALYSA